MTKNESKALLAFLAIGLGLYLISRPNCNHGCKTVAEHLLRGGISSAFALAGI